MNISFSTIPNKPAAGRSRARHHVALAVGTVIKLAGSVRGGFAAIRGAIQETRGRAGARTATNRQDRGRQ